LQDKRRNVPNVSTEEHDRPTPASGIAVFGKAPVPTTDVEDTRRHPPMPTPRIEEFESAERLADRMLAVGRTAAAEQILVELITDVLEAARDGQLPNADMVDAVGRCGVKLANATLDARWADAAIELHLLAVRPLRPPALRQLTIVRSRTHLGDDALIARYYEALLARRDEMSAVEQELVRLVADLVPDPNRNR
jgi:hypothetical protein